MSDGAGITATPAGSAIGIDIDAPTPVSQPAGTEHGKAFMERVPESYAKEEWVANLSKHSDPFGELFKEFANQRSLIGRKAEGLKLPGEGATPEDWTAFHKAIGVPESADKYEYKAPEVDEKLKPFFQTDEALVTAMKEAALKAGVRPEGFKHMYETFDKYYIGELEKGISANNEMLSKLETSFKTKFGERSNQVIDNWKNSLSSIVGKEQAAVLDNLDPAVKVVLAEHFEGFAKKYIREDSLDLDKPAGGQQMTQGDYSTEYGKIFAKVRGSRPGSAEHAQATQEMQNLRARGEQIFKK